MYQALKLTTIVLVLASKILFLSAVAGAAQEPSSSTSSLIEAVRSGKAIAIMRHAIAPGTGDPDNFDVNDCSTQRNLSEQGREQARSIGQTLRDNGLNSAAVYSSEWCRCRDTASLLGIGEYEVLPTLNSFFGARERMQSQMAQLNTWLDNWNGERPLVLVTHQVVISALTGIYPRSGETVVFERSEIGEIRVLGSFI